MRKHSIVNNHLSNIVSTFINCINDDGDITNCKGTTMPDGRHNLLSSATFISCIFTNLIAFGYSGGAIYFADQSEGTLTVTNCFFEHCEVSISQGNGNGGGAIYAGSVSKVNIVCSSFIRCRCNNTKRSDGGAIGLYNILTHPRVTACTLLFCMAEDDGGAMSLWSSSGDANQLFCDQSFFLQNTASGRKCKIAPRGCRKFTIYR